MPTLHIPSRPLAACLLLAAVTTATASRAGEPRPATANAATAATDLSATPLRARVQPAHEDSLRAFSSTDRPARDHALSEREWALVEHAIDALPALHRQLLQRHLARLSFVDGPGSPGTALTRTHDGSDGQPLFDITVRADVLETSLSAFLTGKDARLFNADDSGYRIELEAGTVPALEYLLLHEATHVVDGVLNITADGGPFRNLWTDYLTLAAPLDRGPLAHSLYRRKPAQPLAQAPALYAALADSPFVSLYSTASAGEDLAELVAWHTLSQRSKVKLAISIVDGSGKRITSIAPLTSTAVQARMQTVDAILARANAGTPTE
ncbi:hypothetical protein [Xanthomonas maliensis]|uniref:hypothetical protein n=1 Tax=Xanthomonas maliensis TaxID=1321368 RepID=UPI0003B4359A|nr:hypothetical protein [Xanthomonas maliensis]KAB7765040.1 hypothetical protein CKY51_16260 [Xanthomonas maliensis]